MSAIVWAVPLKYGSVIGRKHNQPNRPAIYFKQTENYCYKPTNITNSIIIMINRIPTTSHHFVSGRINHPLFTEMNTSDFAGAPIVAEIPSIVRVSRAN